MTAILQGYRDAHGGELFEVAQKVSPQPTGLLRLLAPKTEWLDLRHLALR
jgi:hypothetical protein